jgi:hypothetical protein
LIEVEIAFAAADSSGGPPYNLVESKGPKRVLPTASVQFTPVNRLRMIHHYPLESIEMICLALCLAPDCKIVCTRNFANGLEIALSWASQIRLEQSGGNQLRLI